MVSRQKKLKLAQEFYYKLMRYLVLTIKPTYRRLRIPLLVSIFFLPSIVVLCNFKITSFSKSYLYSDLDQVPFNYVGLVLGTSKNLSNGRPNPYLYHRLEAAYTLYKAGKVKYLLLSGDNQTLNYNEPRDMKKILLKMGIPEHAIFLDFAGFRTLDSVIRCRKVFGQQQFTIISQGFHNERAIYIARNSGIEPIAFNAKDVHLHAGIKVQTREIFARVKAILDIYILKKEPKFLGEKIQIAQY